jgi:hypothetical protein
VVQDVKDNLEAMFEMCKFISERVVVVVDDRRAETGYCRELAVIS